MRVSVSVGKKKFSHFGDMVFTKNGISGPIILSISSEIVPYLTKPLPLEIDLKPALDEEVLDKRLLKDFAKYSNKEYKNSLDDLLPRSFIPIFVLLTGIAPKKKCNELTREDRKRVLHLLKHFPLTVTGTEGFAHAVVTKGGVLLKEVDPKTMQSKLIKNLYITGELLDLDGVTGGYNLQAAFSTGFVAGFFASNDS